MNGYTFVPFALESFGGMGTGVSHLVNALAIDAEGTYGILPRAFKSWAMRAVSVALQAGNGRVVAEGLKRSHLSRGG